MSLRTSQAYLDGIKQLTQQSIQQGLQQGLQQGHTDGERALVLKQLTRKLGMLSPELTVKVNDLNVERLEALGEDLLDFTGMVDLESWLGE